jgi:hypothetical protein
MTAGKFVELYEGPKQPVVLTGVVDQWPAAQRWTPALLKDKYGEHKFKVGWGWGWGWGWGCGGCV